MKNPQDKFWMSSSDVCRMYSLKSVCMANLLTVWSKLLCSNLFRRRQIMLQIVFLFYFIFPCCMPLLHVVESPVFLRNLKMAQLHRGYFIVSSEFLPASLFSHKRLEKSIFLFSCHFYISGQRPKDILCYNLKVVFYSDCAQFFFVRVLNLGWRICKISICPKDSIMVTEQNMVFSPIELKFFFWVFHTSRTTKWPCCVCNAKCAIIYMSKFLSINIKVCTNAPQSNTPGCCFFSNFKFFGFYWLF